MLFAHGKATAGTTLLFRLAIAEAKGAIRQVN
jgi:hypothetical protein